MAVSEVTICNLALSHIAQSTVITSINPPDSYVEADHCARFYPVARDQLLEMHAWKFAVTRATIAELVNTNLNWQFCYALPADCVRPLAVLLPESTDDKAAQPFETETTEDGTVVIFTNVESAVLKYIRRVTDPNRFTPLFVVALSHLLASYIAGPITKRKSEIQEQQKLFLQAFLTASGASAASSFSDYRNTYTPSHLAARND